MTKKSSSSAVATEIRVRPVICLECGSIQLQADAAVDFTAANCDNPECQADNVLPAGRAQSVWVAIDAAAWRIRSRRRPGGGAKVTRGAA